MSDKYQVETFLHVKLKLHGQDEYTMLTPDEARELARSLIQCADHAEKNTTDLNNQEPWTKGWVET